MFVQLMDYDLVITPSLIVYSLGLQWAWQFNIFFLVTDCNDSYCDHYITSSNNKLLIIKTQHGLNKNKLLNKAIVMDNDLVLVRYGLGCNDSVLGSVDLNSSSFIYYFNNFYLKAIYYIEVLPVYLSPSINWVYSGLRGLMEG